MLREFHIDSFPANRVWIRFKDNFRKMFFEKFTFKKINGLFENKLNYSTFKRWKNGKHDIPLWFVLEISKKLQIPIREIEKNISSYKGPSTSTPIKNPNLPLVEDERLVRIVTHILCDGWVGGAAGTNLPKGRGSSGYRNFEPFLLNQFEQDLSVFGKIKVSKNYEKGNILFSNLIRYILEKIYKIKFGTYEGRLPKYFWNLDKNLIKEAIKAFGDDEGHVYDGHIDFYSNNKNLLNDAKSLLQKKFPNISLSETKINKSQKQPKYYFYVLAKSRETFAEEINFHHPEKNKDLSFNIIRTDLTLHEPRKAIKNKIVNILTMKPSTAKEISRKLYISHGTILEHLNDLKKKGKVKIIGKAKYSSYIWGVDNDIR